MKKLVILGAFVLATLIMAGVTGASADSGHREYRFLVGAGDTGFGFLCDFPTPCPDVAEASNGDTIEISGEGTLSIHPKTVTGAGSFTHNFAGGGSGTGKWTAMELLSFKSYGPAPGFPETFEAGLAKIRVHLVADGGGMEADAILSVGCILPNVKVPGGLFEGARLNIQGLLNFNKDQLGATLFIRTD